MNLDNANIFGIAGLILLMILGGYLILIQIRESFYEKPDPKLTSLPKNDFEKYAMTLQNQITELASLTHANARQIAALAAQTQIILQRIGELTAKIDRLQERTLTKTKSRI